MSLTFIFLAISIIFVILLNLSFTIKNLREENKVLKDYITQLKKQYDSK